jgi:hypothetical protein
MSGRTCLICCFYYSNIITISNNNIVENFLNFLNTNTRGHFQIYLLLRSQYRHLVFLSGVKYRYQLLTKEALGIGLFEDLAMQVQSDMNVTLGGGE